MMSKARFHTFSNCLAIGMSSRFFIQPRQPIMRQCYHVIAKPMPILAAKPLYNYTITRLKSGNISRVLNLRKQDTVTLMVYSAVGLSICFGAYFVGYFALREYKKMKNHWRGITEVYVPGWKKANLVQYKNTVLPQFVADNLEDIEGFEVRPDDIWVVSFPRSGTTWLQEIVYLLHSNFNWVDAETTKQDDRFPYFEFMYPGVKSIVAMESPRLIKSHLPLSLLPKDIEEKKPKIIYIARNPKDVLVSYFYFIRKLKPVSNFDGKFEKFYDFFLQDKVMYAPWWRHVLEFWDRREDQNILFITYEELKMDTPATVRKVAKFLGKTVTDSQLSQLMEHCSFKNMRNNKMVNHNWFIELGVAIPSESDFVRKGCIGDWTNHITREMNPRIDRMIVSKLHGSGLKFTYQAHYRPLPEEEKMLAKEQIQTK